MTLSPSASAVVELMRKHGHTIDIRWTRGGSPRFTLDGRPECDAHTLANRYYARYERPFIAK